MTITQCFVEFIIYSFLGWIWESIYCTLREKRWEDRGFLFGPICPIYGVCVVAASVLFTKIPALSDPSLPLWAVFLICGLGSAVAEFGTSWVLEKRFHARWWDYSNEPFNIQGRICVPVSIAFGLVGILVVKFLIPVISGMHETIHPAVYEILALIFAALFGADFALTEASLSALLKNVEKMHAEYVERAQAGYERVTEEVSTLGLAVNKTKLALEERVNALQENLSGLYARQLSFNQRRVLVSIKRFMPNNKLTSDQNNVQLMLTGKLKSFARAVRKTKG